MDTEIFMVARDPDQLASILAQHATTGEGTVKEGTEHCMHRWSQEIRNHEACAFLAGFLSS